MTALRRLVLLTAVVSVVVLGIAAARHVDQRDQIRSRFRDAYTGLQSGDTLQAAVLVRELEGKSKWTSWYHLLRGAISLRTGGASNALYEFAAVGSEKELRQPLLLMQAEALLATGRAVESESLLHLLAAEAPNSPDPHRWLAAIYHQRGAMEAAEAELLKVTTLDPDHYLAWRQLGLIYQRDLANNAKAIECYQQAVGLNPPTADRESILRELAEALIFRREYRSALSMLQQVRADDGRSLALKAECHASLDESETARHLLQRALAADPDDRFALLLSARFHMTDGRIEMAIRDLNHALQIDPNDFTCRLSLAVAYERLGDTEASRVELEKMQQSRELRTELTSMFLKAARDPDDALIREQITELCLQLGRPQLAESWRRAADISRQIGSLK